ncbi:MAG TPA: zinc finger domain-containing protein, partial [Crinalium sp.]
NLELAERLRSQGYKRQDYRHYVFNRDGKPCYICGTPILKEMLGGRRCYYCPTCQNRSTVLS